MNGSRRPLTPSSRNPSGPTVSRGKREVSGAAQEGEKLRPPAEEKPAEGKPAEGKPAEGRGTGPSQLSERQESVMAHSGLKTAMQEIARTVFNAQLVAIMESVGEAFDLSSEESDQLLRDFTDRWLEDGQPPESA